MISQAIEILNDNTRSDCKCFAVTNDHRTDFIIEKRFEDEIKFTWCAAVIGISFVNVFNCITGLIDNYNDSKHN